MQSHSISNRAFSLMVLAPFIAVSGTENKASECPPSRSGSTVFEHATVITMTDSIPHNDYSVVTEGGKIAWVGPASRACIPRGSKRIAARGMYLMPALADMHVHMDTADTLLYIANGITHVREMNGTPDLIALRNKVRTSRESLAPAMSVSGPLLAGVKQRWRHKLVESPDSGVAEVIHEKKLGYDAIKVYDGLTPETYQAIVATAAKIGIPVVGHIPQAVGLDRVLTARQRTIEHGDQIIQAASKVAHGGGDSALVAATAARIAKAGTWITPTLAAEYSLNILGTTGYAQQLQRPEMRFADPDMLAWWNSLAAPRQGSELSTDEFRSAKSKEYFGFKEQLVRELDRAGVPMLAGTDTPNPLMLPGFGLTDELVALSRAGLSNYRVLRMATRDASRFLDDNFGEIKTGRRADIILMSRNPLDDITALRALSGVMVRGKWLDRPALDRILASFITLRK